MKNKIKNISRNLFPAKWLFAIMALALISISSIKAQDTIANNESQIVQEKRLSFVINIIFQNLGGIEGGFEFDISNKASIRSTYVWKIITDGSYTKYSGSFFNQLLFYSKEGKKGLNHGPFLQLKDESHGTTYGNSHMSYYVYGLGYSLGYRFKISKSIGVIPNFSLAYNYFDYKVDTSGDQDPSIIDNKTSEWEPRLQLYFSFSF